MWRWKFEESLKYVILAAVLMFLLTYFIYPDFKKLAEIGDMFNSLGVLIAGFAFVALVFSIRNQQENLIKQSEALEVQKEELRLQREELSATRGELRMQREEMRRTAEAQQDLVGQQTITAQIIALENVHKTLDDYKEGEKSRATKEVNEVKLQVARKMIEKLIKVLGEEEGNELRKKINEIKKS